VFWPTFVPASVVEHTAVLPDGTRRVIPPAGPSRDTRPAEGPHAAMDPAAGRTAPTAAAMQTTAPGLSASTGPASDQSGPAPTRRAPLGLVCGARSGDKGGNANVGLWSRHPEAYGWLRQYLDVARFRELLPEAADLEVRRYELPNLCALNFVVVGLLGLGVAASTRPDPQAKGLGEYIRSRHADIPLHLLPG
jgi:hypothetical protein